MKVLVLLNRGAGSVNGLSPEELCGRIEGTFAAFRVEAEVRALDGPALAEAARAAADLPVDAVIAAGGDGTVNTVAAALAGTSKPMGVLPLGTFNHFAKELGIPQDLDAGIAALATAQPTDLDVAEVNGRLFLNFTGIGLHPSMVRRRDEAADVGKPKLLATIVALLRALRDLPVMRVGIASAGRPQWRVTPSVIVCTNTYQMKAYGVEHLSIPQRGVLNVYVARTTRWYHMLWIVARALFARLDTTKAFEVVVLPEVSIFLHRRRVAITIDGDVETLEAPLVYRVRRGGLRVLVPAPVAPG